MSNKLILFVKNFSYALISNITSFVMSVLIILVLPKVIGIAEYGYFQFYSLLATYVLVLHFGLVDGIYLRYGGESYKKLDYNRFTNQLYILVIISIVEMIIFIVILNLINIEINKYYIFIYLIISIIFVLPKTYFSVILQATNRMKEYSMLIVIEKVIYVILIFLLIALGIKDYKILLISDLIGKICAMFLGIIYCKEIVFTKFCFNKDVFIESIYNVKAGIFLVLSNLCNILITGIIQFFIENRWNIETFGKVSLTFNISRMLMVVINSVSVVLFPLIKHIDFKELSKLYNKIRSVLMVILMALLLLYYPMKVILNMWLPQYSESFSYAALLLPMCIFESKSLILASTYLKSFRKESILFSVNVIVVFISLILSIIMVNIISSLELAVLSITIVLMMKSILLEYFISKVMDINFVKNTVLEICITIIFVLSSWFVNSFMCSIIYLIFYILYIYINRICIHEIKKGYSIIQKSFCTK